MPRSAIKLLPDWIGIVDTVEDLPNNCVAMVDEAYLQFHSMERGGSKSAERSKLLNLSRQKNQALIFVAQDARQLDRYVIQASDVFVIKELSSIQVESERPELRDLLDRARTKIAELSDDRREFAYVVIPGSGYEKLVRITSPSFWSDNLSNVYGQTPEQSGTGPTGKGITPAEAALELRKQGLSYAKIGKALGVAPSTAYNLVNDYPYKG